MMLGDSAEDDVEEAEERIRDGPSSFMMSLMDLDLSDRVPTAEDMQHRGVVIPLKSDSGDMSGIQFAVDSYLKHKQQLRHN